MATIINTPAQTTDDSGWVVAVVVIALVVIAFFLFSYYIPMSQPSAPAASPSQINIQVPTPVGSSDTANNSPAASPEAATQ